MEFCCRHQSLDIGAVAYANCISSRCHTERGNDLPATSLLYLGYQRTNKINTHMYTGSPKWQKSPTPQLSSYRFKTVTTKILNKLKIVFLNRIKGVTIVIGCEDEFNPDFNWSSKNLFWSCFIASLISAVFCGIENAFSLYGPSLVHLSP